MSKAIIAESHFYFFTVLMLFVITLSAKSVNIDGADREVDNQIEETGSIRPYSKNPWYWEYKGEPVILRGGSDDDNLWQWTAKRLTDQLDLLQSLGGNYLRNTMSDRTEGNVFAHAKNNIGMYDLEVWNDEYWNRLDFFLDQTKKRNIIVQVTLWDWFDLAGDRFSIHPLNPENNVNWGHGVLTGRDDYYGGSLRTGNQEVLDYQHRYIDQLLSLTFKHNHVLYNIGNESSLGAEWENYWATYLNNKANQESKEIYITSMQFLASHSVRHVLTYRDMYSFVEISQNSQDSRGGRGKAHYDNVIHFRRMIKADQNGPMPMNNEKIYGSGDGRNYSSGTGREAEDRFWKNIFAGCASVRFHRPEGMWGIGLSDRAQANIKSMSMFLEVFDIFNAKPYEGIKMYSLAHEGYAMANTGKQYAVYLPGGRYSVELDPWVYVKKMKVKYLDIDSSTWSDEEIVVVEWEDGGLNSEYGYERGIPLTSPSNRPCVVVVDVIEK